MSAGIPDALSVFRFCAAQLDLVTGERYLTDPVPFTYRDLDDTIEHTVTDGDTWENIAARYYPDLVTLDSGLDPSAILWRVVAEFQPHPPMDGTIPPERGSTVYVPSLRTVLAEVFSEARRADYEA